MHLVNRYKTSDITLVLSRKQFDIKFRFFA
jgi:hypothetical protein